MEDFGDIGVRFCFKGGVFFFIFVKVGVGVSAAEDTVGDGDADEEEMEELPCSRKEGGCGGFRDLGREERKESYEDGEEDGFVEEV